MINNPPADVMAEYLVAQGLFTDPSKGKAWPIYLTHEPDAPTTKDDVGTIYDTIGVKDGRVMSGENIFHFGIQVRVRAQQYLDGWQKARDVVADLETVKNVEVLVEESVYTLVNISQTSQVLFIGLDESTKRRNLFTVNFLATLKEV